MVSDFRNLQPQRKFTKALILPKSRHFAAAISSDGEIIIRPHVQIHKMTLMASTVVSGWESFRQEQLIIGLESTAHYGDNLGQLPLLLSFISVCVEPHQNLSNAKNNVRKTKTDKVDTYVIAKTLMMPDNSQIRQLLISI